MSIDELLQTNAGCCPQCYAVFEKLAVNQVYCTVTCAKRAERQRRKEKLARERAAAPPAPPTALNQLGYFKVFAAPTIPQLKACLQQMAMESAPAAFQTKPVGCDEAGIVTVEDAHTKLWLIHPSMQ